MIAAPLWDMVARGGIEPPTRGFSIRAVLVFGLLISIDIINLNQQHRIFELYINT